MSPRPLRLRKVSSPPPVSGFKPYGNKKDGAKTESVFLHFEEYEALRLCDYEMLNHHQASVIMDVSRPTLTRIYAGPAKKLHRLLYLEVRLLLKGARFILTVNGFHAHRADAFSTTLKNRKS